ncbi:MAG TPA: hypothetical protein VM534_02510 [Thermoanaerobaculia bacterium]|nr:hypothetical protein [Thermoanaerobaculia bacterium]
MGRNEQKLAWIPRGRSHRLTYLQVDPKMDSLRAEPRFAELVEKMGFPE